ncbi:MULTISPECIES: TIGR00341 family protein [unclassified Nodularia (in: cyanobacteria)]|uniref:TIGR00341 family protein n=1 Tax=unclassified Nodularia (in: cyanobacteria) TaxID=2656917 RepID=UPI001D128A86|nr:MULTISPECIES: TIGR00341 family protein [unclassified Nodularia (in: cyanobacteria)]
MKLFLNHPAIIGEQMWLIHKVSGWGKQRLTEIKQSNSGEWHWLAEKPMPIAALNRSLWRGAISSKNFYILLFLSGIISTVGLLANSAATIIGAMIVAPLMGPIIAIAYSMAVGNQRLLKRSSFTLFTGIVLTVVTSMIIARIVGIKTFGPEIWGRVSPTLLDLAVALAAGAAGAYAKSRRHVADALPGVAIAVALVPPLSVIGIGIAIGSPSVTNGASLLFLTNLIGIIFSGALVFLAQRYGSLERARQGLILSIGAIFILGLPLGFSLENLLLKERTRRSIEYLLYRRTLTFSSQDIRRIQVERQADYSLVVELEVAAPIGSISENQVNMVRDFVQESLKQPLTLNVRVIPVQEFTAPAPSN